MTHYKSVNGHFELQLTRELMHKRFCNSECELPHQERTTLNATKKRDFWTDIVAPLNRVSLWICESKKKAHLNRNSKTKFTTSFATNAAMFCRLELSRVLKKKIQSFCVQKMERTEVARKKDKARVWKVQGFAGRLFNRIISEGLARGSQTLPSHCTTVKSHLFIIYKDSYSSCKMFMVNISVIIKWGELTTPRTATERPYSRLSYSPPTFQGLK